MAYPGIRFFVEGDASRTVIAKVRALEHTVREGDVIAYTPPGGTKVRWKVESTELDLSVNPATEGSDYLGAPILWVGVSIVP
jgi:hypothetical protein